MRKSILFLFAIVCAAFMAAQEQLPKWEKGYLDIHHINTGRGSCAFLILPDGTNMMIDAGDLIMRRLMQSMLLCLHRK